MAAVALSTKSNGSIVKIKENGVLQDFYIEHGYPTAGNGRTLFVRRYIHSNRQWHTSLVDAYASSSVDSWLNGTYLGYLPADIQGQMAEVSIHYTLGGGKYTTSNLSRKVFLLSITEIGLNRGNANKEGTTLGIASTLQKPYASDGAAANQWTRTPAMDGSGNIITGSHNSISGLLAPSNNTGVRPAFTLPSSLLVLDDGSVSVNTAPTVSGSNGSLGNKNADFSVTYSVNDVNTSDTLTVTEYLDGTVTKTINSAVRNQTYTIPIQITTVGLGSHTITITVSDSKESASRVYTFSRVNALPTISGTDQNLGDKNTAFDIYYQVNDSDGDAVNVTVKLNSEVLSTVNNILKATDHKITISDEKIRSLTLDSVNTITIEADDGKGGITYRRYTFKRTNTAPVISGENLDLGLVDNAFSQEYSVSDTEGDVVTVTEKLNSAIIRSFAATLETGYTVTIPQNMWLSLPNGIHSLIVEAKDEKGAVSARIFTFEKRETQIILELAAPFETDELASKVVITPTWNIIGAVAKIEVCNNAFDEFPVWEDITAQVYINRFYTFFNTERTAEKAGVNFRFTIIKNEDYTGEVSLSAIGGAFE